MRDHGPVPLDDRDREVLRGLIGRLDLEAQVRRVEDGMRDMPEYQRFVADIDGERERDRGRAAIRWNVETFTRWLADGQLPADAELERLRDLVGVRAAEGRPPEEGLAVYRRGLRLGWDTLHEAATQEERVALSGAVDLFLAWVDLVSKTFTEAYARERDALISQHERRARTLIDRLVTEAPLGSEDLSLADILGFRLAERYRPFVATLPGGSMAQHTDLAARLRKHAALAATEGRRVIGLAHDPVAWDGLGFGPRLLVADGPPTQPVDLDDALQDLRAVARIGEGAGARGRLDPGRYAPELLLHRSPQIAQRLADRVFGPLLRAGRPELAATLRTLAQHGFERTATADALPVHRNTLTHRLARISRLTGLDLDDVDDRGLIWLAARADSTADVVPTSSGASGGLQDDNRTKGRT
jgi:PucR C-terminal helix-turn-helix domain